MRLDNQKAIAIAVEMEKRGAQFYARAALIAKKTETRALLNRLEQDEQGHMADFQALGRRAASEKAECFDEEADAYLAAIAADIVFPGGVMELLPGEGVSDPEAVLRYAIRSEKDSILFYSELIAHTQDASAREMIREIVQTEQGHLVRLIAMLEEIRS